MNLFTELRQRRVPQIVSAYVVGSWGLIQFIEFLEGRMQFSPHLVTLIALCLLMLLPSVIVLAWCHGRPGPDQWGKAGKSTLPINLVVAILLLLILFQGKELGAVARTIEVVDENGAVTERTVPKSEFRRRVILFYPGNEGDPADDLMREAFTILLTIDLSQDSFIDVNLPLNMLRPLQEAGHGDGHGLPRQLKRKIARDAHYGHFVTWRHSRTGDVWRVTLDLHDSERGRVLETRDFEDTNVLAMMDRVSRQLREDLGVPKGYLATNEDLPVADLTSQDLVAVRNHVQGIVLLTHANDWEGAVRPLQEAVARDPGYALAHFLLYGALNAVNRNQEAQEAMAAAMENLYRLPERTQFQIKSQYYYNIKQDADKAMAVLKMWSQLYPDDPNAYAQQAMFYYIRQDLRKAIGAYEKILAIDPSQHQQITEIGELYQQLGEYDEAENYFRRYADLYPARSEAYESLADLFRDTGRLDDARDALDKALLIEPDDLELTLDVAVIDMMQGDYEQARAVFLAELERTDTARSNARVRKRLISLEVLQGRMGAAVEHLAAWREFAEEFTSPLQLHLQHALSLPVTVAAGREQDGLRILERIAANITPPFGKLLGLSRAWLLAELGEMEEAAAALEEAIEIIELYKFETLRAALDLVGGILAEARGDLEAAAVSYRAAMAGDPSRIRSRNGLARVLRESGEVGEAAEVLERSLKLHPAHPVTHLEMALVLHGRGDGAGAREHLLVALGAWDGRMTGMWRPWKLGSWRGRSDLGDEIRRTTMNEFAAPVRNRYFFGRVLKTDDFEREQYDFWRNGHPPRYRKAPASSLLPWNTGNGRLSRVGLWSWTCLASRTVLSLRAFRKDVILN